MLTCVTFSEVNEYMAKSMKRRKSQAKQKPSLPRPLLLALGGALLLGLGLLAYWRGNTAAGVEDEVGQPNLVVDREVVDFSDVRLGEWVTASFTLTNTGAGAVRFTEPPYIEVVEGC